MAANFLLFGVVWVLHATVRNHSQLAWTFRRKETEKGLDGRPFVCVLNFLVREKYEIF